MWAEPKQEEGGNGLVCPGMPSPSLEMHWEIDQEAQPVPALSETLLGAPTPEHSPTKYPVILHHTPDSVLRAEDTAVEKTHPLPSGSSESSAKAGKIY